jgi:hypothetical protein
MRLAWECPCATAKFFDGCPTYAATLWRKCRQVDERHLKGSRIPASAATSVANRKGAELTHCRSALHVPFPVCPDPEHDHEPEA